MAKKTLIIRRSNSRQRPTRRAHVNLPDTTGAGAGHPKQYHYLIDSRPKSELPKLGLCKIRTDRFRDLTVGELQQAQFFIGPVTSKERTSRTAPRGLLHRFITNLLGARREEDLSPRSRAAYVKSYGEEPMSTKQIRQGYEREADRVEREIWDAQQKAKCPIADRDAPARDYVREKGSDRDDAYLNKIRGKRKAVIK